MSWFRHSSQSLDSWWRQQVGRWSILFSWSVRGVSEELRWTSGCHKWQKKKINVCCRLKRERQLIWCSALCCSLGFVLPCKTRALIFIPENLDKWAQCNNDVKWVKWTSLSSASSSLSSYTNSKERQQDLNQGWYDLHFNVECIQLVCLLKLEENYKYASG